MSHHQFATFWAGEAMPALDRACLRSFARAGQPVTVYGFDRVRDLPDGVTWADASGIVNREDLGAFLYNGRPDMSHFSDHFRYAMFAATGQTWIDTDILLLRDPGPVPDGNLFARETERSLCGAIMRIAATDPNLPRLTASVAALRNTDLVWGATGPRLLTRVFGADILRTAAPPEVYFPIHYDQFWKPFLPEAADECEALCARAVTNHLWNNIVVAMGVWKELAPPEGSFLHRRLAEQGSLGLFRDVYPAAVMRRMVENWRLRKTGGDIGILALSRQVLPSAMRTAGPRVRALMQARR